jgi:hypothetical protein
MKKIFFVLLMLMLPSVAFAALPVTTFTELCYIISPEDKWTYRDYGFTLTYRDAAGKKQTLSAGSKGTPKNCTQKSVSVKAAIPAGHIKIHINDFTGQADSTIECTNTISYHLTKDALGKTCEFIVKTPKYGSYTSTDECRLQMECK